MSIFHSLINIILHLDQYLLSITEKYGMITYGIIFFIIFMETGFIVTPFLPGDSLLFAAGSIAALGGLNIFILLILLTIAAITGDTVNYWIGRFIGPKLFESNSRFFKKKHLDKAHAFYEKHGGFAIVLARFVPIVRTFAPCVAGISKMNYGKFLFFNITGGITWISLFTLTGYFFGNLPFVKENFHYVIGVIIVLSLIPIAFEYYKEKRAIINGSSQKSSSKSA